MIEAEQVLTMKQTQKQFSQIGSSLLLLCGIYLLSSYAAAYLLHVLGLENEWLGWAANFVPLYLIAMPTCILSLRRSPKHVPASGALGLKNFFVFLLMSFALMYLGNLVGTGLSHILTQGTSQNPLETMVQDLNLIKILILVVIAPLTEEYLFRKQLIDHTVHYGEWIAALLSAVSFSLFHMNLYQMVYAFALGLLWSYVYIRTGRLRYSVCLHMIVNFFGSVAAPTVLKLVDLDALTQISANDANAMTQMAEVLPGLLVYLGYALLILGLAISGFILLLTYFIKKRFFFRRGEVSLTAGQMLKTVYCNPSMIIFILLCLVMTVFALIQ